VFAASFLTTTDAKSLIIDRICYANFLVGGGREVLGETEDFAISEWRNPPFAPGRLGALTKLLQRRGAHLADRSLSQLWNEESGSFLLCFDCSFAGKPCAGYRSPSLIAEARFAIIPNPRLVENLLNSRGIIVLFGVRHHLLKNVQKSFRLFLTT
jgi:hypothetical protein